MMLHPSFRRLAWTLFFVVGLLVSDAVLWRVSDYLRSIDATEGWTKALDRHFSSFIEPEKKRRQLEDALAAATTPAETIARTRELAAHIAKMGDASGAKYFLDALPDQFPADRSKPMIDTILEIMADAATRGDAAAVRQHLADLRRRAWLPPWNIDLTLLTAAKAQLYGERELEYALRRAVVEQHTVLPSVRMANIGDLIGRLAEFEPAGFLEERIRQRNALREQVTEEERRRILLSRFQGLIGGGLFDEALELLDDMHVPLSLFQAIGGEATRQNRYELIVPIWEKLAQRIGQRGPLTDVEIETFSDQFAFQSAQLLLGRERTEDFFRMARLAIDNRAVHSMTRYLEAESWARGPREGTPPKPLYRIVRRETPGVTPDGRLDEAVYAEVPPLDSSWWYGVFAPPAVVRMVPCPAALRPKAWIFHDGTHLYFAALLPEPHLPALTRRYGPFPGRADIWNDGFDFLVDPGRAFGEYMTVVLTSQKTTVYRRYRHPVNLFKGHMGYGDMIAMEEQSPLLETGTAYGERSYVQEARIPLAWVFPDGRDPTGQLVNATLRRFRQIFVPKAEQKAVDAENIQLISLSDADVGMQMHKLDFFLFE